MRFVRRFLADPRRPDLGREDHRHAVMEFRAEFVRLRGDDREAAHALPGRRAPALHNAARAVSFRSAKAIA
jgi:hypothetical protein